jgi:hypothetical protein
MAERSKSNQGGSTVQTSLNRKIGAGPPGTARLIILMGLALLIATAAGLFIISSPASELSDGGADEQSRLAEPPPVDAMGSPVLLSTVLSSGSGCDFRAVRPDSIDDASPFDLFVRLCARQSGIKE